MDERMGTDSAAARQVIARIERAIDQRLAAHERARATATRAALAEVRALLDRVWAGALTNPDGPDALLIRAVQRLADAVEGREQAAPSAGALRPEQAAGDAGKETQP